MSDLPAGWAWSTIGELAPYIQRGKSPKYADRSELPVVNQRCIRWTRLETQHLKFIHPEQFDAWDAPRRIQPGDVLWNSTGTGTVGRAYLVQGRDCIPAKVVDSHVTIVRPSAEIEPRFLFSWIRSAAVQDKILDMCDGTTNQIELSRTAIAETAVPVAPATEQARIADQLETLLARIQVFEDRLEAIPLVLKQFRHSVLNEAVTGRLSAAWRDSQAQLAEQLPVPQWAAAVGLQSLPAGWRWARFDELLVALRSGTSAVPANTETGYPVLRSSSVRPMGLDLRDVRYFSSLQKVRADDLLADGDLLFTRLSGSLDYVANCVFVRGLGERRIYYPDRLFRARLKNPDLGAYVELCFSSPSLRRHLTVESKSTAGHQRISMGAIRDFPIPLPNIDEQFVIVEKVAQLFSVSERIDKRLATAVAMSRRLTALTLAKAFRGELSPQNPNEESASALLSRLATERSALASARRPQLPRSSRTPRAPKESAAMTKSRHDDDVMGQPYLAGHLRRIGTPVTAEALFKAAELPVADFYKQLAWEVVQGHVKDNQTTLEPGHAAG